MVYKIELQVKFAISCISEHDSVGGGKYINVVKYTTLSVNKRLFYFISGFEKQAFNVYDKI